MSSTPSPVRRSMLRILLAVAVIATVLPFGATPAQAAANFGVQLDGVDDAIHLGAGGGSPLGASQFTIELWFKRTGTGTIASTGSGGATSVVPLITKGRSQGDGTNVDTNYFLGISTITGAGGGTVANSLAADFEDFDTADNNNPVFGTTVITSNVWHHAAATFNGSQLCLYLDGVLDGSCLATTNTPRFDSIQMPAIGTAWDAQTPTPVAAGRFAGQVDETRVWNVAKTQVQIQAAMNTEITTAQPNLLGRWGMNEGSGTSVAGVGSAGVNGTLVGTPALPTWVSGSPVGTLAPTNFGVQLDGTDDAVNLGTGGGSPLGASQFTLELWFKRTGAGTFASTGTGGNTDSVPLITKGTSEGDGSSIDTNYFFGIDQSSGELEVDFEDNATGGNHPANGASPVPLNVWHHGAATFNGAQLCVYLDGVLDGTCTATTTVPRFDSIQMPAVGTSYNSAGTAAGRFAGQVDEVRIWNVARTQAQIQSSMNTEIPSQMNGLLGRWGMNQGSGTNAANTAGSASVNGTLANGASWVTGAPPVEAPPVAGNYGVQFDGVNDQIDLGPASAGSLGAAQYTLELWFKRTGTGLPAQTSSASPGLTSVIPLIAKGRSEADATNVDVNYFLGIDAASNKLATDFEEGSTGASPGANHGFIGNTVITDNVWHHAAVTYDGSVFRLYLDGALDGTSAPINQPPRSDSINRVGIGVAYNSTGITAGAFQGQIDEVRIWNSARSLAQIQGAMGSEITTGQANLLGRWGLNEGFWINAGSTGGTVNGTLVNGPNWVAGTTFTPPNTAPVVDSVVIDQASPQTNDTLTATVTSHDAESNPVTYAYQWTKNGDDIAGATDPTLDLSIAGNGDKDDLIRLRVTASDASLTSSPLTSAARTVQNSAPSATVSLDDHLPGTNATLTATATSDDADGDTVTLTYVWTVDAVVRQTTVTTALTDTFDLSAPNNGGNGDEVIVTVTPNDGMQDGLPVADTASIGNAVPVVDSVSIAQTGPLTDDVLSATVTSHDDDDDPLTTSYQWTKDGADIAGATDPTLDLSVAGNGDKGDVIRVRVSVDDGNEPSAPVTSDPVTVANTAPTATVALDSDSPGTNDTLTATATSADADGADTVTLTYLWTVNGDTVRTTTTTALSDALDLSVAGNGDNGDAIVVTVTPDDGTANGTGVADTATVGNAAPVIDSVTIASADPGTNGSVSATVLASDPDGPAPAISYQWTRNGSDISGETGSSLDLSVADNGDKGDEIRVRVTASDGSATSTPATSDPVTVANTDPTATVALDSDSPGTNDTLTATATSADADDDTVTLTYLWTVDGDTVRTTTTTALSDALDLSVAGNGDDGDAIVVTVTPNDGTVNGSGVADSATVGNSTPVVDSVSIDQTGPLTDDVLSATVTSHDDDDDPLTTSYQWTKDGADIAGATDPTLDLSVAGNGDKGDVIRVRVSVDDGVATSPAATSDPVTIGNTAPTATVSLDDHSPSTNATLTATATSSDDDDDLVTLTYVWTVDGNTQQTTVTTSTTDTFDLSVAGNGDNGDEVVVTITPNDGEVDGAPASDTATVGNEAPVVDTVTIDQATPRTDDTLSVTVTSHDPDDNPITHAYQWTLNGADIAGATGATLDLSVVGHGDKDDLIRVRVTASDGSATSAPVTSAAVTVLNTAPTATVELDDDSPNTNATLTATATRADADGDTVSLTYLWTVNGVTRQTTTTTALTDTFDLSLAGNGDNGQSVVVTVTPNDGTENGSGASDTAVVGNDAPVVDAVSIDQTAPDTDDTLSVTVTSHDPDDDTVTLAYQWTLNGGDISGATDATLNLATVGNGDRDDLIRVRVTASDGSATSAPVTSAPVTVQNTAPTATVILDDHTPGTNATVTATATRADADDDTVTLTYVWTVNGITRQTTTTTDLTDTFDLSLANHGNNGDTVAVTVTPNDGTANGPTATDSATVGNAAPVVDSVVIDQVTPMTNDVLSATVTASDPDGGSPTPSYQWTRNGTDIVGATNATLNLATAGNGDKDDLIRVRVTVSDGTATSGPLTSSPVTVLNTVPTATVSLNDDAPATDATLTATVTSADIDAADTVTLTYLWTVNGVTRQTTTTTSLTDTFDLSVAGNGDSGQSVVVTVTPNDGTANGSGASDTATVTGGSTPPIFADEFPNLNNWVNVTRITIDNAIGSPAAPSARGSVTNQSAFAYRDLGTSTMTPCVSANVNISSGSGVDLFRLRSAGNGPVIKAFVHASGTLQLRSDFGSTTINSGVQMGTGWHSIELCGTVGNGTTWDLIRDGVVIVNDWAANTGTAAVNRIQIGDTAAKTFTANWDHVRVDLAPGETGGGDTQGPTTPGTPTGTSPSNGTIEISWSASTDASPPITYRVYRDGNPTSIGQTTSTTFTDPGLTPGTSHTYTVDAVDSLNNPSLMSAASASILVTGPPADTEGPTTPGTPTGSSPSAGMIQIQWTASTDASPPITYRVYRDGNATSIGETTSLTFMDPGLTPGTNHTYTVDAVDSLDNPSLMSGTSASITVSAPADTEGPTTPGTPTGSSPSAGTIQISWSASTDASPPITYRVYRDGNPTSIGQTASTTFTDPGLTPGTSHTYTVDAVDSLNNPSLMSGTSASILVSSPPDTQGPTTPGTPTGSSPSVGMIQIQWTASTDASPPITYRVYRDGNPTSIGQTTSLTFMDPGLTPGTNHTYTVDAVDSLNNPSSMSGTSAAIAVSGGTTPPIFSDDFTSGDLLAWTSFTRITIDNANGSPATPSARAAVTNQSAFAFRELGTTTMTPCMSANVNRTSGGADLFRLRTATNDPIMKAVVTATGALQLRSDFGGTTINSGVALGTGWHSIELCGTVGTTTTWDLIRDGVVIVNDWQANTGTTAVGRVQIGDTAAKTFTINFDHVRLDLVPGEGGGGDTQGPTTPGTPTGTSPSNGTIQISWSASTDASPPITYRVYRDGNPTSIGQTTSTTFTDPGLTPGTSHTYRVDAVDSLNNPSLMSGTSASILVSGGDTQGPTTPGTPTGTSPSSGMIQIQWTASTDASPPIIYRVYRDGGPTPIGQTTSLTFVDPGLTPGNSHTYRVDAIDSLNNPSSLSGTSASILVSGGPAAPIFADDFSAGNLLVWTSFTRITIDSAIGSPAAPSARASVTNQTAFAYRDLPSTTMAPCMSVNVNRTSGGFDIFRLRTATGGPIIKAVITAAGALQLRSDFGETTINSGVQIGTGWHNVELCGTVGTATTWDLYRDGVLIVNDWQANTGTAPVGRVQIGDTGAKTFTMNLDNVRLDLVLGG